jgi:glutaminyl-peptide cyclotransferase
VYDGDFFESTGQYGESTLRRVDIETGRVTASVVLASTEFGEGLARVGDRLIQLTWQEHVAYVYSIDRLSVEQSFSYEGEGWGLCFDGERLVMSDGTSELFFRNPETFALLDEVTVTRDGEPVPSLNELECVSGQVYANVWLSDEILRIDPSTGAVLAVIDASGLLTNEEAEDANVLNGIAYDPERRHFFITGKYWPWVFEVEIDEPEEGRSKLPSGCGCHLEAASARSGPLLGVLLLLGLSWRVARRRRSVARRATCA